MFAFVTVLILQSFFAHLVSASDIGNGFVSNCFDPTFESQYMDMSSRAMLYFGVTVLVDYRYLGQQITREYLQQCFDSANKYFANAKFQLVNLEIYELGPNFAPDTDQVDDWMTSSIDLWRQALASYFNQGRVVVLIAQTKAVGGSYIAGRLVGAFPENTNQTQGLPFLWMNTDALGTKKAPAIDVETMVHELSHGFGLFHTFEKQFGCTTGDAVSDTVQSTSRDCNCNENGLDTCGVMRTPLDCTNIMSYGVCRVGTSLTAGQYRRMRCVIENDCVTLTALSTSGVADLPVLAPTPQQDTVEGVVRCNGIPGACIDTNTAECSVTVLPNRCAGTGNIQCCPYPGAPWVNYLPGVNASCIGGVSGVCQDIDRTPCATGYLGPGFCAPGAEQVQCCPDAGATIPQTPPAIAAASSTSNAPVSNTVALPIGYTVHVGDSLWLPLPQSLVSTSVYVLLSDVVYMPQPGDLNGFDVAATYAETPSRGVMISQLLAYNSGAAIDRGDYIVAVTGQDSTGASQTYVSTSFTIDVNGCAVDINANGVPYGLQRTAAACAAKGAAVSSTSNVAAGLVCCVPSPVVSDFNPRASQNDTGPPLGQQVQWIGLTSFWGAPMQLTLIALDAAGDVPVPLSVLPLSSNIAALSSADVTLNSVGDVQSFTPAVGNPGQFQFIDATGVYASSVFSVASLPCELSSGVAGYCMPMAPISAADGVTTPDEVCAHGETAQCAGLQIQSTSFACCQQSATAIQKQAAYLQQLATYTMPVGSVKKNAGTTLAACAAVVLAAIVLGL